MAKLKVNIFINNWRHGFSSFQYGHKIARFFNVWQVSGLVFSYSNSQQWWNGMYWIKLTTWISSPMSKSKWNSWFYG